MSSWQTQNLDKASNEKQNKIRKRGCSSSSSSSLVRRYRFKRAILLGKSRTKSLSMVTHQHPQLEKPLTLSGVTPKQRELSVSARKLAATSWEIDDLPPWEVNKELELLEQMKSKKDTRSRHKAVSLSRSEILQPNISDPSYSPISERMKGSEGDSFKRRVPYDLRISDSHSRVSLMEVAKMERRKSHDERKIGAKNSLKEARNGLSTSKKLLKVLNQMCLKEKHSLSIPLILALGSELDRSCDHIDQLLQEQTSNQNDIECLMKHFAEEKAAWKRMEREKVYDAIRCVAEELEVEKKLRRQTERLNKKIAKEMASVKALHLKASKELEGEKRAKEILEQICDELARGIGEDRALVEELKRELAKVREEVEKERKMLQLAEVLREERVQMKLSEARYQFEEKNALLENLRNELEAFLSTKEFKENGDISQGYKKLKHLEAYLKKTYWEDNLNVADGVEQEGEDSADSDLHSIELNMDNDNKCYKWSYAYEDDAQRDSIRVSVDKRSMGRKSLSEKIQWGSICFNRVTANCKKRDFVLSNQQNADQFDQQKSVGLPSLAHLQDHKDETDSHRSFVHLRNSLSSAPSPQRRDQLLLLQDDTEGEAGGHSLVLEADDLNHEAAGRKSGC